MLRELATYTKT